MRLRVPKERATHAGAPPNPDDENDVVEGDDEDDGEGDFDGDGITTTPTPTNMTMSFMIVIAVVVVVVIRVVCTFCGPLNMYLLRVSRLCTVATPSSARACG